MGLLDLAQRRGATEILEAKTKADAAVQRWRERGDEATARHFHAKASTARRKMKHEQGRRAAWRAREEGRRQLHERRQVRQHGGVDFDDHSPRRPSATCTARQPPPSPVTAPLVPEACTVSSSSAGVGGG